MTSIQLELVRSLSLLVKSLRSARSRVKIRSFFQRHLLELTLDGARFNTTTRRRKRDVLLSWKNFVVHENNNNQRVYVK